MYDRAARSLNITIGSTSEHVGLGTYDHRRKKFNEASYAPFLSLTSRGDIFPNEDNPGPGYYDLRHSFSSTIKGGSTLANKASRFGQKLPDETPGPGSYDFDASHSSHSTFTDPIKNQRQNIFRFNRKSLPPSIPDPKYAFGFEEDEKGKLVPQQPPSRDASLGPAFYNTSIATEIDSSKFYQGTHFGKYSSKRTDFSGREGPGPSDYDPNDSVRLEIHHMNMKSLEKRSELQIARYPEMMLKTVAKDNVPGPGQYTIKRELDPVPSKSEITGLDYERPAFGSQTNRFESHPSAVPGPATYDDKVLSAFHDTQTKPTSFKQAPFNQTAARFVNNDYKLRSEPGPGQYRMTSFADQNLRRAVVDSGRKPPFNVATLRRLNMTKKDDIITPGPNTYNVSAEPFKTKLSNPSANFISQTAREPVIEDTPGPTSYDVSRSHQALNTQQRQPPRSKIARKRQSQFLSTVQRKFGSDTSLNNPGPADYDGFLTSRPHGYAPVRDARFHTEISQLPGPADYELSPLLQDTVLRGTFNSTLNNPILAKLQSRARREQRSNPQHTMASINGNGELHDSLTYA